MIQTAKVSEKDIKEMFENFVHVGHRTQKWNPRMKKYLYGDFDGVHVINLEKTFDCLQKAIDFMYKMMSEGKIVLFVSTKPQTVKLIEDIANSCGMPFVATKWIPGLLTNFSTIKTRIKYLADLKEQEATGEFEKYTKKEASKLRKIIEKLQASLGGVQNLKSKADVIFVVDVERDKIVVTEANKLGIPVVAFIDSNSDPNLVDYPIPANDDAMKSLKFLMGKIEAALKRKPKNTK